MIERAAKAIHRSDALLERTKEILHQSETLAAKHEASPPTPKIMK